MFKNVSKKQWISLIVLVAFALVISIVFFYLYISGVINFRSSYVTAMIGFIYLFIGWVVPNNIEFKYRKKTAQYSGKLPDDVKKNKFAYRFPLISASILTLIISLIFDYLILM